MYFKFTCTQKWLPCILSLALSPQPFPAFQQCCSLQCTTFNLGMGLGMRLFGEIYWFYMCHTKWCGNSGHSFQTLLPVSEKGDERVRAAWYCTATSVSYLVFSYYSTPEFVMITEKLCCSDTIFVDDISDSLKDLIKTSHWWFLERERERERERCT